MENNTNTTLKIESCYKKIIRFSKRIEFHGKQKKKHRNRKREQESTDFASAWTVFFLNSVGYHSHDTLQAHWQPHLNFNSFSAWFHFFCVQFSSFLQQFEPYFQNTEPWKCPKLTNVAIPPKKRYTFCINKSLMN